MSLIHLTTFIAAPIERVFDLSRSINLHKISTADTKEEAVAGKMSGLINEGEKVTWKAKHLFKIRYFTSKITAMVANDYFIDELEKGDFKFFKHEHHFKQVDNGTIMIDLLEFESPYGIIGQLADKCYLKNYLQNFLIIRNNVIKDYAESQKWKALLNYYN
jgi:ligand-binding SRPBCC domain-containing protein